MEQFSISTLDIKILEAMQEDASLSNQDLAERLHVSPPTCLRRVKKLREAGLIEREVAILSPDKLAVLLEKVFTQIREFKVVADRFEVSHPAPPRPGLPPVHLLLCRAHKRVNCDKRGSYRGCHAPEPVACTRSASAVGGYPLSKSGRWLFWLKQSRHYFEPNRQLHCWLKNKPV